MPSQKLKQKSPLLTLRIGNEPDWDIITQIGGEDELSAYFLELEIEDKRLQYKHLNLSYNDRPEIPEDS